MYSSLSTFVLRLVSWFTSLSSRCLPPSSPFVSPFCAPSDLVSYISPLLPPASFPRLAFTVSHSSLTPSHPSPLMPLFFSPLSLFLARPLFHTSGVPRGRSLH